MAELFNSLAGRSIYLHFAADQKQLLTSYQAGLWGLLSPIKAQIFCYPRLNCSGEIRPIPSDAAFSAIFRTSMLIRIVGDVTSGVALDCVQNLVILG